MLTDRIINIGLLTLSTRCERLIDAARVDVSDDGICLRIAHVHICRYC